MAAGPTSGGAGDDVPKTVNSSITDSVTQVNTEVVGMSPGVSTSNLYSGASSALTTTIQNTAHAQHSLNQISEASTSVGVKMILQLAK